MLFQLPEMVELLSTENYDANYGPECCSVQWKGCCYKE